MEFLFENLTNISLDEKILESVKAVIEETLIYENFPKNSEISFSIVTNEKIRELNKNFRGIDKETDVLSFPLLTDFEVTHSSQTPIPLGDIIISIEKAKSQAKEYSHSLLREISFLTVHSMLHLLGYDHMTKKEEETMFKKQEEILNKLNITR